MEGRKKGLYEGRKDYKKEEEGRRRKEGPYEGKE